MRTICAVVLALMLAGCQNVTTTETTVTTEQKKSEPAKAREKTTAEEAFDAGQRARKKAEAIKSEQDKKNAEAVAAADQ